LTDSFLETYQRFAPDPLSVEEADRFVLEQSTLGSRLRSDDLPQTRTELNAWVEEHPAIAPTEAMADTIAFLKNPPLPTSARVGYRLLYAAAVATIPERIAQIIGVSASRAAVVSGTVMLSTLRWALGSSPSWWLALERTGSQIPDGVHFLRPPPVAGIEHRFIESTQRGSPGHRTEDRFGGSK
jgi:hypothetical protein